jgi:hypothetical protein
MKIKSTLAAPADEGGFLDEQQILKRIPVSRRTWYGWRKKGLPFIRIERRILYDWESVRNWLLRHQRETA